MSTSKPPGALLICALLLAVVSSGSFAADKPENASAQSSYRLRAFALGASGAPAAGVNNRSNSTLGQSTPVGSASTGGTVLYAGFWGRAGRGTPTGAPAPVAYVNRLFQNYPNPFNPATTVKYSVAEPGPVEIRIFNVRGQTVRTLVAEHKPAGPHKKEWDGRNNAGLRVASGVYFCRLRIGTFSSVKKLVLLK